MAWKNLIQFWVSSHFSNFCASLLLMFCGWMHLNSFHSYIATFTSKKSNNSASCTPWTLILKTLNIYIHHEAMKPKFPILQALKYFINIRGKASASCFECCFGGWMNVGEVIGNVFWYCAKKFYVTSEWKKKENFFHFSQTLIIQYNFLEMKNWKRR